MMELIKLVALELKIQWYILMEEHYKRKVRRHKYNQRKLEQYTAKKVIAETNYEILEESL